MPMTLIGRMGIALVVLASACGGSSDYADAASIIVPLDPPLPVSEIDSLGGVGAPGLDPMLAYFYVPSEGPESIGTIGLEQGAEFGVGFVASAFAEDGRTDIEQLLVYGIGFTPMGSDDEVERAVGRFLDRGFTIDICNTSVARGGCYLPPPDDVSR